MNKIIWTCWFQGQQNAPDLVKRCLASWATQNPDWDFRCLDAETVSRYIDLSEHIDLNSQTLTAASLSDIVRLLVLHEYGGVWVDATLYCNQPLNDWLPQAMGSGFFAFSKPAPDRLLSSWFIAAEHSNLLLAKWTAQIMNYWHGRKESNDYFWLHHQFGELCTTDQQARSAWEKVPRISADGPHAIQSAGMYEPMETTGHKIDWTTPVFKLTHRIDENAYHPGCLVHHLLHSRELAGIKVEENTTPEAQNRIPIAGLKVSTENLGDHIQILASLQLLKRFGISPKLWIDRDHEIATADVLKDHDQPLGILLNGWFKTNPAEWPPHPKLIPIYLGFHIRLFQSPSLVAAQALDHYRQFGPVGCRDRYTLSLLRSHSVNAFISHCLSLTFSRRIPDPDNQTETFIVSRDKRILDYLPNSLRSSRFISHYTGIFDFMTNLEQAKELLALYRSRAKLIITTMLHCALPAIAMGIPVVIFFPPNEEAQHRSDIERFSSLQEMIRVFELNEVNRVDWQGYVTDVSHIKLSLLDHLVKMASRWGYSLGPSIGPIAPASALPGPSAKEIEEFIQDTGRIKNLASASAPDRQRWGHPSSYKAAWDERANIAASFIPDNVNVLEIGTGLGNLRRLIQHRCTYTGADLEPLDTTTIVLNLDNDPLPFEHYDYIVALGVFEYLHKPQAAAAKIASSTDHIVLTYCCAHGSSSNLLETRINRGWVNHLSEADFVHMFTSLGLQVSSRKVVNSTDDFEQIIFEFFENNKGRPAF